MSNGNAIYDTDQGQIEYRRLPCPDWLPNSMPNEYEFRPVGRDRWARVKLRLIRENLDAGLHPRTGVYPVRIPESGKAL